MSVTEDDSYRFLERMARKSALGWRFCCKLLGPVTNGNKNGSQRGRTCSLVLHHDVSEAHYSRNVRPFEEI